MKEELFTELLHERVYARYGAMYEAALSDTANVPTQRQTGEMLAAMQARKEDRWLFWLWFECLAQAGRDPQLRKLAATFWRVLRILWQLPRPNDRVANVATPVGQGDGINGRGHIGRLASPTALLGTAVFLFTAFQLAVSDALARGGSGSHSFHSSGGGGGSSGGSGSSHFHNHFINNGVNGGGSSGGSAGVIVAIVVAVIVVVVVTFLVIRRRRQSKPA